MKKNVAGLNEKFECSFLLRVKIIKDIFGKNFTFLNF